MTVDGSGASIVCATEAFDISARFFETIADALTAIGQLSIIGDSWARTSDSLKLACGFSAALALCAFIFAQQSCEGEVHESAATMVSVDSAETVEAACVSLLHPNRHPAPAIQRETLMASDKRRIWRGSRFTLVAVYSSYNSVVDADGMPRDWHTIFALYRLCNQESG